MDLRYSLPTVTMRTRFIVGKMHLVSCIFKRFVLLVSHSFSLFSLHFSLFLALASWECLPQPICSSSLISHSYWQRQAHTATSHPSKVSVIQLLKYCHLKPRFSHIGQNLSNSSHVNFLCISPEENVCKGPFTQNVFWLALWYLLYHIWYAHFLGLLYTMPLYLLYW